MLEGDLQRNIQATRPLRVLQWVSIETSNQLGPKLLGISLLMMKEGANANEYRIRDVPYHAPMLH
jgi:hypothetical protein